MATPEEIARFKSKIREDWKDALNTGNVLGWSESRQLLAFMEMYAATKDTFFLDKLVEHGNAVLSHRDDYLTPRLFDDVRKRSGVKGWSSAANFDGGPSFVREVHSGMICYPLILFARVVSEAPELQGRYQTYVDWFQASVIESMAEFASQWRLRGLAGYYDGLAEFFKGKPLPFNQLAALGRVFVELGRLGSGAIYTERAVRLANFWKGSLKRLAVEVKGQRKTYYVWPFSSSQVKFDDLTHAALSVDFATVCHREGLVFNRTDINRLANTLIHVCLKPDGTLADRVDGSGVGTDEETAIVEWLSLAPFNRGVYDLGVKLVLEKRQDRGQLGFARILKYR